ncbi:hypothetical protein Tco_0044734 [Tanacetum coccineum]
MELENTQNNALAKLPMLKLGEYEMWEIRIKQYFQIQDYALWEVIENGNSWVPILVTTSQESGTSTTTNMNVVAMATMKNKTSSKKTHRLLLKLQNENFIASSSETLDSIFNRLQKLVSRLAILGVVTPSEDLNVKFLRSLPSEWDTHVVKSFKKSAGLQGNDDNQREFVTTSRCKQQFLSDATVYAFLSTQPKGSQLVHEDLEQLHDDDLEEMDFKVEYGTTKHGVRSFIRRTGRKNHSLMESNTARDDKQRLECLTAIKWDIFARNAEHHRVKTQKLESKVSQQRLEEEIQGKKDYTDFNVATYKRGFCNFRSQMVLYYKEHEVLFSEEIALLKRSVGCKEYELGLLRTELEKITDKSKKGVGYNVVPSPHPLIINRPTTLDLSYSGLEEFKELEINEYGPRESSLKPTSGCDKESFESPLKVDKDWKEKFFYPANHVEFVNQIEKPVKRTVRYADKSLVKEQDYRVNSSFCLKMGTLCSKPEKKTVIPIAAKIEKPVRKPMKYAEMYRSQRPMGKPKELKWSKIQSVRMSVNNGRPFSTARSVEATTDDNGEVQITATIDGHSKTITEASLRRHLKLDDHDGITSIPNLEIFEQLALMGYHTYSDKLTFQKGAFSPQWRKQLQQHSRTYPVPSLSIKVFNNMKRPTKGYSSQEVALFHTMLNVSEPSTSPSRITSSLSHSPEPLFEHSPDHITAAVSFPSPTQPTQPSPGVEQHIPTPHDSPLHVVHSHGSDEGSLKLTELTTLVTKLSKRIGVLEDDLKKTKLTYSATITKLILKVKKLEVKVKAGTARKRARVVLSKDDADVEDDSSKQGRKLSDAEVQEKASTETKPIIQEVTPTEVIQDQGSSEKGILKTVTYRRRGEEKRTRKAKGKAIMTEHETKKKSKKELEQERLSFIDVIRLQEQMDEEQRAQIARDEEIARQWNEEEEQRAMSEAKSSKKIYWNDPSVIRYHALKMKPKIVAQARRNMVKYLKNQGNYKNNHGSEKMKSPEKIEEEDVDTQKEMKEVSKRILV